MKEKLKALYFLFIGNIIKFKLVFIMILFGIISTICFGFSVASAVSSNLLAYQQREISGQVTDTEGQTLPGVTIIVKGTLIGTVTDQEGGFSLRIPEDAETLQFSLVGMESQEVLITDRTYYLIIMSESLTILEEVVVVGYGTQRRESITGAISSTDPMDVQKSTSANLGASLAGRISGLVVTQQGGGQPGFDDPQIYLRGIGTLNTSTPLILIDGVPRDNIRQIDAREIESISVLKDAAATAVFGVRGANGAIIITTKRGVIGKPELTVFAEQGLTSFTREDAPISSVEWMRIHNEMLRNDNLPIEFTDDIIAKYENPLQGLDPSSPDYEKLKAQRLWMYPDHDWYRMLIKRITPETRVSAGVSGGTERVSYYGYAGFFNQGGNLITEDSSVLGYNPQVYNKRFSFRGNLDYNASSSLRMYLNLSTYIEESNSPRDFQNLLVIFKNAQSTRPITPGPLTIEEFGIDPGVIVDVPYHVDAAYNKINRAGYANRVNSVINSTYGLDWDLGEKITPGLSLNGMISFDSRSRTILEGTKLEPKFITQIDYNTDEVLFIESSAEDRLLSLSKSYASRYTINAQAKINYSRRFGRHNIGAMAVGQRDYWEAFAGEIPYNIIGIAVRATYDYDYRYFGEVNIGYNGSEQFAPANRFGFFPAVSLGWVASNENFFPENQVLTFLKLRGSHGKAGNDRLGSERFLFMDDIAMGSGPLQSLGRGQGVIQRLLGNPYLQWEEATKTNIGVDIGLIHDLNLSVDYFYDYRDKILVRRGMVPAFQGVPLGNLPLVNIGEVENKGVEVEVNYRKSINKDLFIGINGNYGHARNKVLYADEPMLDEDFAYQYRTTGFSIGQLFGYEIDWESNNGYWMSHEEIQQSDIIYQHGTPRPGDFKYIDQNGDGVIDQRDLVPIGYSSRIPRNTFGLNMLVNYKSIDFSIFFQGVSRYSKYYSAGGVWSSASHQYFFNYHRNAWTEERHLDNEIITYPALSTATSTSMIANDFFIMDRSYVRLRNVEIGFSLPDRLLNTLGGIKKARIYAGGQNLFLWDNLRLDHLDPEIQNEYNYPVTKTIKFGLQVTF